MNNVELMWDFPVREGVSFPNANRVHPLMQVRVGSALQFRCNSGSDLDLYIEKREREKKLEYLPDLDCEIDIVVNLSQDSKLYREIERTGLLLFER